MCGRGECVQPLSNTGPLQVVVHGRTYVLAEDDKRAVRAMSMVSAPLELARRATMLSKSFNEGPSAAAAPSTASAPSGAGGGGGKNFWLTKVRRGMSCV